MHVVLGLGCEFRYANAWLTLRSALSFAVSMKLWLVLLLASTRFQLTLIVKLFWLQLNFGKLMALFATPSTAAATLGQTGNYRKLVVDR